MTGRHRRQTIVSGQKAPRPPATALRACSRPISRSSTARLQVELLWWVSVSCGLPGSSSDALRQLDLRRRRLARRRRATSACPSTASRSCCSWRPRPRPPCCLHPVPQFGRPNVLHGTNKEFEAIITAVVGGTLLTGGYGSAVGSALGAFILGATQLGIFFVPASTPTGTTSCWRLLLLLAVLVNTDRAPSRLGGPLMNRNDLPEFPHDNAAITLPHETAERIAAYGRPGRPTSEPETPVLEARDISKFFGRVIALETCRSRSGRARSTACSATTARASRP